MAACPAERRSPGPESASAELALAFGVPTSARVAIARPSARPRCEIGPSIKRTGAIAEVLRQDSYQFGGSVRFKRKPEVASPLSTAPSRIAGQASVVIANRTPAEVWAFIKPAESAVLVDPTTIRSFSVPGTGPGVGEEQYFVKRARGQDVVHGIRVTAEEPGHFAEAVSTTGEPLQRLRWEVHQVEAGTQLTATAEVDLPAGLTHQWIADAEMALRSGQEQYVRRVQTILMSGGWSLPAD